MKYKQNGEWINVSCNLTEEAKLQLFNDIKAGIIDAMYPVFFNDVKTSIIDAMYPVGSIYITANSVDPSTTLGGVWKKIENRFLLSSGSKAIGTTGGSETNTHYHYQTIGCDGNTLYLRDGHGATASRTISNNTLIYYPDITASVRSTRVDGTDNATINIMPPYLVVNVWKRIE